MRPLRALAQSRELLRSSRRSRASRRPGTGRILPEVEGPKTRLPGEDARRRVCLTATRTRLTSFGLSAAPAGGPWLESFLSRGLSRRVDLVGELRRVRRCPVPQPCPVILTEMGAFLDFCGQLVASRAKLIDGEQRACDPARDRGIAEESSRGERVPATATFGTLKPESTDPPLKPGSSGAIREGPCSPGVQHASRSQSSVCSERTHLDEFDTPQVDAAGELRLPQPLPPEGRA